MRPKRVHMTYSYYLDGLPISGPQEIAIAIDAPLKMIKRRLVMGRMSWRGHIIEQRPADEPLEDLARPLGLERWMARRDRMRYGGLLRREIYR
jgi:hypothetical protein